MAKTSKVVIFIGIATKSIPLKSCQMNAMRTALLCAALLGLLSIGSAAPLDGHHSNETMLGSPSSNKFYLGNTDPDDPNRAFNNLKITKYIFTDGESCDGTLYRNKNEINIKCDRSGSALGNKMASELYVNFDIGLGKKVLQGRMADDLASPNGECQYSYGSNLGDRTSSHINFAFRFVGEHRITGCIVAFVIAQVHYSTHHHHNGYHIYATTDNPDARYRNDYKAIQFPSCGIEVEYYPFSCSDENPFTFLFI